jgi:hypothetical protein
MGMLEWANQVWHELISRPAGPMAFRFILQPVMASIFAARDGIKDARLGRKPYLWMLLTMPHARKTSLWEAVRATSRILILGLVMDLIYQAIVFRSFRVVQAVIITFFIAFLPYILLRGPASRIARLLVRRKTEPAPAPEAPGCRKD